MKFNISFLISAIFFLQINAQGFPEINPENIDIVRSAWGVPHIFAKTDAEVAYGLAWANAEDAFAEMQDLLIIGKGMNGRHLGVEGAKADFFRHVIQAEELVEEKMYSLPGDFLQYMDGYVQGANAYAAKHPDEIVLKNLFPVTVKDALTSYVVALSFMTDASGAMEKIYEGKLDTTSIPGLGSNAFAINSKKSADGRTYLAINPHMQMTGTFSFYEAHLHSEEGLNMYGPIFQGGTSIYMGNNEHLGWGMTWNHFNRGDIYKLEMHPKKKNTYMFDGEWHKLETKKIWLKVKVAGITIPVLKKSYYSKHGPVLRSNKDKSHYYAFRYPAFMDIKAPLQWYRMNKAKSLAEFKEILDIKGIGLFNIVYADKEDNLYYVSYGQVPYRADSIANIEVLPGNDSKYIWQRLHTLEELPHEENPDCNYIYNTNNSPFFATCDENKSLRLELKSYLDERPGQNNRATVMSEFLESKDKISYEEFQAIKFDNSYSENSYLMQKMKPFLLLNPEDYPEISDALALFQSWSNVADFDDAATSMVMVTIDKIFSKKGYGDRQFIIGFEVSEEEFIEGVTEAQKWFLKYYGKIDVPLKEIFYAKKGKQIFSSPGFPDALAANYGFEDKGKYIVKAGDTYTQFVAFDENGPQDIRTIVPFGNSNHVESPYYMNQSPLFQKQKTKKVTMDKETIYKLAREIYNPK